MGLQPRMSFQQYLRNYSLLNNNIMLFDHLNDNNLASGNANLRKMANYIATIPQEVFSMSQYRTAGDRLEHKCNTIGCVIGHCTILDEPKNLLIDPLDKNSIDFPRWSEKFCGIADMSDEWLWCFSPLWMYIDNTPTGASKRIYWLLDYGLPDDFMAQLDGKVKPCYK